MVKNQSVDDETYPLIPDEILNHTKKFGFEQYAKTIVRLIAGEETQTPITISIHGAWGSGKSSLMRTVQKIIEDDEAYKEYFKENKFSKVSCKTIWFNAWEYECEEDIGLTLLHYIGLEIEKDLESKEDKDPNIEFSKVKKYLTTVGEVAADILIRKVGNISLKEIREYVTEDRKKAMDKIPNLSNLFKEAINEYTEKGDNKRIIIFIDDLDRCNIKNAKNIIDTIRLFLTTEKCIFILGLDIDRLQKSLDYEFQHIKDFDAREYINKIVQLRFELPPLSDEDVEEYAEDLLPGEFEEKYIKIIIQGIKANPRNIKLFINNLRFQLTLSQYQTFDVKKSLLIMWLVLKHTYPQFSAHIERQSKPYEILTTYMNEKIINEAVKLKGDERKKFIDEKGLDEQFLENKKLIKLLTTANIDFNKNDLDNVIHQTASSLPFKKPIKFKGVRGLSKAQLQEMYRKDVIRLLRRVKKLPSSKKTDFLGTKLEDIVNDMIKSIAKLGEYTNTDIWSLQREYENIMESADIARGLLKESLENKYEPEVIDNILHCIKLLDNIKEISKREIAIIISNSELMADQFIDDEDYIHQKYSDYDILEQEYNAYDQLDLEDDYI